MPVTLRPGPLGRTGFTLVEALIAVGLIAVTSVIFATMFTNQVKSNRAIKTVGTRDIGYYQVGRFAGDIAALSRTFRYSNSGTTGVEINPCFRTCLDQTAAIGCPGGSPGGRCTSHNNSSPRVLIWHPLTLYSAYSGLPIAGPNPAAPGAADERPRMRYTIDGELCLDHDQQSDARCPIVASTEFNPVCPRISGTCNEAASVVVRYSFSWTTGTHTAINRSQVAALKSLSGQVEVSACQISGFSNCQGFYWSPTNANTGTSTATGPWYTYTATSTRTATSTQIVATGTETGTGIVTGTRTDTGVQSGIDTRTGTGSGTGTSTLACTTPGAACWGLYGQQWPYCAGPYYPGPKWTWQYWCICGTCGQGYSGGMSHHSGGVFDSAAACAAALPSNDAVIATCQADCGATPQCD